MTVENLEINVKTDAGGAIAQLKSLAGAISAVKAAAKGGFSSKTFTNIAAGVRDLNAASSGASAAASSLSNLSSALAQMASAGTPGKIPASFINGIRDLNDAAQGVDANAITALRGVGHALSAFSNIGDIKIPGTVASRIKDIAEAANTVADDAMAKLESLANALSVLADVGEINIPGTLAKRISDIAAAAETVSEDAISNLREFAESLQQLGGIDLGEINEALKSTREEVTRLANSMFRLRKEGNGLRVHESVKRIGDSARASTKHTNRLFESIKRIAFYRILRTIIKEIGQAFQEGLTNAYHFSETINGTLAATLDNLATKSLTMKNQLGSAFGELLQALEPILVRLVELVTRAADAVSQLIAAFTGKQTYLKALEFPQKWAESADEANKATSEWKNQVLGFDEINKLNETTGAVSGASATGTDYSKMFQVAEVDTIFQKIRAKFDELIGNIDFTNLIKAWERLKASVKGLANVISGALKWAWDNVLAPLSKWTMEEAAPRLVNLLAAGLDFLTAVAKRLAPILEPLWENTLKPFFQWCGDMTLAALDELIDLLEDLTALVNGDINWDGFIGGLSSVQTVLLAIGGLAVVTALGNAALAFAGFVASTGAQVATFAANMSLMQKASLIAADAVLVAYDVSTIVQAAKDYNAASKAYSNEVSTALNSYKKLYDEKGKEVADQWAEMVYQIDLTGQTFEESQQTLTERIDELWADAPKNWWEGLKQGWNYYFGTDGIHLWRLCRDALDNFVTSIKNLFGIHSPSTVFEGIGRNLVEGLWVGWRDRWDVFTQNVSTLFERLKSWWQNLSVGGFHVPLPHFSWNGTFSLNPPTVPGLSVEWYAKGGFPDVGELFVARERGPELVGSLGGHNAVANNAQIEAGIEEAAYRGFVRAMSASGGNQSGGGSVVLNVDGKELARAVYDDFQSVSRERGRSLINNFA